jgi:hypothetical protein
MEDEKPCSGPTDQADSMVFGFDRISDEQSLTVFLRKIARPEILALLIPRLADQEIVAVLDLFTGLLKTHLSETEFHHLFLGDK